MPVSPRPGHLWSGYLLSWPRLESEEFNPLGIDCDLGDSVFFAEVVGLLDDELQRAIDIGGPAFANTVLEPRGEVTLLDVPRRSLLRADA
jgi:hypothetical protein